MSMLFEVPDTSGVLGCPRTTRRQRHTCDSRIRHLQPRPKGFGGKGKAMYEEIQRMAYIMNSNTSRIFEGSLNQEPACTFCMPSEAVR